MAKVAAGALPIARPPPIRDWRGGTPAVSSLDRVLSDLEAASREAAGGDRAGRESPIVLRGEYKMHWLPDHHSSARRLLSWLVPQKAPNVCVADRLPLRMRPGAADWRSVSLSAPCSSRRGRAKERSEPRRDQSEVGLVSL